MNYNGLAKIIPFIPRAQVRVGPPWSTAELGELFRVAHVLRQSGMAIETDMGLSDEGDPWFVFYSTQTEDVIAHFARLNGQIVVHGLSASGVISGVDLNDVVRRIAPVQAMENQQRTRSDSSVVLHPFMMLVAFVAASFLATEESQAASVGGTISGTASDRHVDSVKVKSDWLDRAMTLLNSKSKDRGDLAASEAAAARKLATADTTHHSMALVMLAAAIAQAKTDLAELVSDATDVSPDTKHAPVTTKLVADAVTAQNDVVAALDANSPSATHAPVAGVNLAGDHSGQDYLSTITVPLASPAVSEAEANFSVTPVQTPSAVLSSPASTPAPTVTAISGPEPEHLSLPETIPLSGAQTVLGAPGNLIGKAVVSTLVMSSAGPASFDVTFEGGTLQFHQNLNLIDFRLIDLANGQGQTMPDAVAIDRTGFIDDVTLLVTAQPGKILSLTNAQESVLIDTGDVRIRNFTFGVDQLVLQNPEMMHDVPEVLFSYTGDIIIKFNETTKVTLLGVFTPGDLIASVASVSAL